MRDRRLGAALLLLLLALAVAACGGGGGGGGEGVASLGDDGDQAAAAGDRRGDDAPQTPEEMEAAAIAFARCMREHGVDMPDPEVGERGGLRYAAPSAGRAVELDAEEFEEAHEECEHLMPRGGPGADLTPEELQEMQDELLGFARCMREQGIDMPDPKVDGDGRVQIIVGGPGEPGGPDDGRFEAARKACEEFAPGRPGVGVTRPS